MGRIFIKRIEDDPDLSKFDCGNGSIQNSIKEAYLATLLKQGYAYDVRLDGEVIGHYMLMIAPYSHTDDEDYYVPFITRGHIKQKIQYSLNKLSSTEVYIFLPNSA